LERTETDHDDGVIDTIDSSSKEREKGDTDDPEETESTVHLNITFTESGVQTCTSNTKCCEFHDEK
jgi:hypothetical protein